MSGTQGDNGKSIDSGTADAVSEKEPKKPLFSPKVIVLGVVCLAAFIGILVYSNLARHKAEASSMPQAPQINNVMGAHPVSQQYAEQVHQEDHQTYVQAAKSGQSAFPYPEFDQTGVSTQSASSNPGEDNSDNSPPPQLDVQASTPATTQPAQISPAQQQAVQEATATTDQANQYSEALRNLLGGSEIPDQSSQHQGGMTFTAAGDIGYASQNVRPGSAVEGNANSQGGGPSGNPTSTAAGGKPLAPAAGTLLPAKMVNGLNSDAPGPAIAVITSGPLAGARVLGSFVTDRGGLTLKFTTMTVPNDNGSTSQVTIQADAISEQGDQVPADVNDHFWENAAVTFIAGFGQGMGNLLQSSGSTTTTTGTGLAITTNPALSLGTELGAAAGGAIGSVGGQFQQAFGNRPPTVKIAPGTQFTLAFLGSDATDSTTAPNLQNIRPTVGGLNTNQTGGNSAYNYNNQNGLGSSNSVYPNNQQ